MSKPIEALKRSIAGCRPSSKRSLQLPSAPPDTPRSLAQGEDSVAMSAEMCRQAKLCTRRPGASAGQRRQHHRITHLQHHHRGVVLKLAVRAHKAIQAGEQLIENPLRP